MSATIHYPKPSPIVLQENLKRLLVWWVIYWQNPWSGEKASRVEAYFLPRLALPPFEAGVGGVRDLAGEGEGDPCLDRNASMASGDPEKRAAS